MLRLAMETTLSAIASFWPHLSRASLSDAFVERLTFVNDIFRLHEAILKVRQRHFDGQIVLFADCAAKLNKQLEMADFALELHNSIAEQLKLPALTKDSIYEGLQPRGRVSCHPVERYC